MKQKPQVQMIDINLLSKFIRVQGLNKNLAFYVEDNPGHLFNLFKNDDITYRGKDAIRYLEQRGVSSEEAIYLVVQLHQIIEQCFKSDAKKGEKKFVLGQRFF